MKLSVVQHPTPSELHEAGLVNKNLQRRMLGQYKSNRHSELVKLGLGEPVDAVALWAKRLAIYDPQSEHGASNAGAASLGKQTFLSLSSSSRAPGGENLAPRGR